MLMTVAVIHVVAAILFIGNIIVTAVWKANIDRSSNLPLLRFGIRLVLLTDYIFTLGGAVLLVLSGGYMMHALGLNPIDTTWLLAGISCFAISGAIWLACLFPNQLRQKKLLGNAEQFDAIAGDFRRLTRQWNIWGTLSTVFALVAMVSRC